MVRRINWTTLSLAVAATLIYGQAATAQCDSGGCGGGVYANVASGGFGYPGSGCGGCDSGASGGGFAGHHNGALKQRVDHLSEIHKRDFARNQAWPKPFDCADRQLYFAMWEPMLTDGFRANCVFTDAHFDPETNELNKMGISKIRGIFMNSPLGQKVALVQNHGSSNVVDARLQQLQSTVDTWYGTDSFSEVALTDTFNTRFSGSRVELINQMSGEETPAPIIPVSSGAGSTSDSSSGE